MSDLEIMKIGITDLDTDCIVNAANSGLAMGSGVCGAIFRAAGSRELQAACDKIGYCPTGGAVITPGFALNPPMPDLSGVIVKNAEEQVRSIRQGHFYYIFIGYKTGDPVSPDNLDKYEVLEQSQEPETIIEYKSTITFKCKKTEAAKKAERKEKEAAKAEAERIAREEREEKLNLHVWYTNTGDLYHLEGCRYLKSKNGPVTQREALQMGKQACTECMGRYAVSY